MDNDVTEVMYLAVMRVDTDTFAVETSRLKEVPNCSYLWSHINELCFLDKGVTYYIKTFTAFSAIHMHRLNDI